MKTINKSKISNRPKNATLRNSTFRVAKCRMGVPVVVVELTDNMLVDLFKSATDEWDLILLSTNSNAIKNIATLKKLWIEKFFNALCLETLSRIRGKFLGKLPIPDSDLQLNSENLRIDSQKEIKHLRSVLYHAIESRKQPNKK